MASRIEEPPTAQSLYDWANLPRPEYVVNTSRRHRILSRILRLPTDEEVEAQMVAEREAEKNLPEIVPPDDPWRMELEARLRSLGHRPATVWNFPLRTPVRKPDWRDWVRTRLGG